MSSGTVEAGPLVERTGVTFRYEGGPDVSSVRLVQEVVRGRPDPPFDPDGAGRWVLRFERPPVDRFEYRFEVARAEGPPELGCDPANPLRTDGPFGERSVIEFPEYLTPDWVGVEAPAGERTAFEIPSARLDAAQPAILWSPAGTGGRDELPLLVALDGFELDRYSGLTAMLDVLSARGDLPPLRALLLQPTSRTDHYSANPDFAGALAEELLPAAEALAPSTVRVGLGASLAGLALLHSHHGGRAGWRGLFLQSGSFLRPGRLLGFEHAPRIERFVASAEQAGAGAPIPIVMTCGIVEENMADNRAMASALRTQGFRVQLHSCRDAHNWISWRDAWAPHLPALFAAVGLAVA